MDAERWRAVRAIFDGVVDAPATQWPHLLDAACADDHALRADVTRLLEADLIARGDPSRLADRSPEFLGNGAVRRSGASRRQSAVTWSDVGGR